MEGFCVTNHGEWVVLTAMCAYWLKLSPTFARENGGKNVGTKDETGLY